MTFRRGGRPSQVRPRPPSTGRPPTPSPTSRYLESRVASHRPLTGPSRGLPLVAQALLVVAVAALAVVVLWTAAGQLPRLVGAIGDALGGVTSGLLASPTPSPTPAEVIAPPRIDPPDEPYTNHDTVDITGSVPANVAGRRGYVIRIYLGLPDQPAVQVRELPVPATPAFIVADLPLQPDRNDITATVAGPNGESAPSPVVTYVLDKKKPAISITSPKNGQTVNGQTVTIKGKTQGRSEINVHNQASGDTAVGTAKTDGTFSVVIRLEGGTNAIKITATDPAGNAATKSISVLRGSGKLTLRLNASSYQVSKAILPEGLTLRATLNDPDGRPIANILVSFTLTIPGVPAITGEARTNASGVATFRTTIPKGATVGTGDATALADTSQFGQASTSKSITIQD